MGKTYKDRPGWTPVKNPRAKQRRGCKRHGVSDCDYCTSNLRWPDQVVEEKKREDWLEADDE